MGQCNRKLDVSALFLVLAIIPNQFKVFHPASVVNMFFFCLPRLTRPFHSTMSNVAGDYVPSVYQIQLQHAAVFHGEVQQERGQRQRGGQQ